MIPVENGVVTKVDLHDNHKDTIIQRQRKGLLRKELNWCRNNYELIERRVQKVYALVTETPEKNRNLTRRCCNFKKLENILDKYISKQSSKNQNVEAIKKYPSKNILKIDEYGVITDCNDMNIKGVEIPESASKIGRGAFAFCIYLKTVTIPDSVKEIDDIAFYGCNSLNNISIPNSVNKIGNEAFASCKNLLNVTMPKNLLLNTNINNVFKNTPFANNWSGGGNGDGDGSAVAIKKEIECVLEDKQGGGRGR